MGRASTRKSMKRTARRLINEEIEIVCRDYYKSLCSLPLRKRVRFALRVIMKRSVS